MPRTLQATFRRDFSCTKMMVISSVQMRTISLRLATHMDTFRADRWWETFQTDTPSSALAFSSDPVYLKLAYTAATSTLNIWGSTDGTTWTEQQWGGGSYDLVRTDLTGALKVGIALSDYAAGSGNTAQFANFSLTTVPEPGAMVLLATGLIGLLAYAWRKRR